MISQTVTQIALNTSLPYWTCLGLLLFLSVFVGAVIWVYRGESSVVYAQLGQMPLDQNETSNQVKL